MPGQMRLAAPSAVQQKPLHGPVGGPHIRLGLLEIELVEEEIKNADRGFTRGTRAAPLPIADQMRHQHQIVLGAQLDDKKSDRLLLPVGEESQKKSGSLPFIFREIGDL